MNEVNELENIQLRVLMKWDEVEWMDERIDTWGGMDEVGWMKWMDERIDTWVGIDEVGWSWVNGWENIYLWGYGWSGMKLDEWDEWTN